MSLEFTEYDQRFEQFMAPITSVIDAVARQLQMSLDAKNLEVKVSAGCFGGRVCCTGVASG